MVGKPSEAHFNFSLQLIPHITKNLVLKCQPQSEGVILSGYGATDI
jgi:hypothetical protein